MVAQSSLSEVTPKPTSGYGSYDASSPTRLRARSFSRSQDAIAVRAVLGCQGCEFFTKTGVPSPLCHRSLPARSAGTSILVNVIQAGTRSPQRGLRRMSVLYICRARATNIVGALAYFRGLAPLKSAVGCEPVDGWMQLRRVASKRRHRTCRQTAETQCNSIYSEINGRTRKDGLRERKAILLYSKLTSLSRRIP